MTAYSEEVAKQRAAVRDAVCEVMLDMRAIMENARESAKARLSGEFLEGIAHCLHAVILHLEDERRLAEGFTGPDAARSTTAALDTVELRIFHADGYDSVDVLAAHCLTAASGARFDFRKVRRLRLIGWSCIDADGNCLDHWDWDREPGP